MVGALAVIGVIGSTMPGDEDTKDPGAATSSPVSSSISASAPAQSTVLDDVVIDEPDVSVQQPVQEPEQPAESPQGQTGGPLVSGGAATVTPPADTSRTVYVTQTGKRYHYDNSRNGGTYYESTLNNATGRGLTPCQKCAGG